MQTGWKKDDKDNWYYLSTSGAKTGWQTISSGDSKKRYYFTTDAVMVSGKWLNIDSKWYYFEKDGSLAVSTTIDSYKVDENGERQSK
jgi:glucan-binding YG repeat protein